MTTLLKYILKIVQNSLLILSAFCCFEVSAHGDLLKRIHIATEQIKAHPDSANLYFQRAKLYYQHNELNNSLKDLKNSKKLGFKSIEYDFLIAKNHFKLNHLSASKRHIKKILKSQPENVKAFKLLGQIHLKKGDFKQSAESCEYGILYSDRVFPENYIETSEAWYALKTEKGIESAKSILLKGIAVFNDNIVLYNKLISIYEEVGDFSSAIKYQNIILNLSNRKEQGYLKLANLQILEKSYTEARNSLELAKIYYSNLPNRIKTTNYMKSFLDELELKLNEIKFINDKIK